MPKIYNLSNTIDYSSLSKPIYVDTNAIVDLYYPNSALVPNMSVNQKIPYHSFIRHLFSIQKKIHITTQVLMEMENAFVRIDQQLYEKQNNLPNMRAKAFRKIQPEMVKRKSQYSQTYKQIFENDLIECKNTLITQKDVDKFINSLDSQTLDSNDYILAQIAIKEDAIILTDDQDFATPVVQCDLITNNPLLIQLAQSIGFTLAN